MAPDLLHLVVRLLIIGGVSLGLMIGSLALIIGHWRAGGGFALGTLFASASFATALALALPEILEERVEPLIWVAVMGPAFLSVVFPATAIFAVPQGKPRRALFAIAPLLMFGNALVGAWALIGPAFVLWSTGVYWTLAIINPPLRRSEAQHLRR